MSAWKSFVAELATRPDVIDRLMTDHRPNEAGLCVECRTPGLGTPKAPWPCPLWTVAAQARLLRAGH